MHTLYYIYYSIYVLLDSFSSSLTHFITAHLQGSAIDTCVYACVCAYTLVCVCVCVHVCMYACACMHMCVHISARECVCMCEQRTWQGVWSNNFKARPQQTQSNTKQDKSVTFVFPKTTTTEVYSYQT